MQNAHLATSGFVLGYGRYLGTEQSILCLLRATAAGVFKRACVQQVGS